MSWFMDLVLARRLERAEGAIASSFVAVRQQLAPQLGATWHDFDGTYAIFDGADSPMTQTFGLGLFSPASAAPLSEIEAFFARRGAAVVHEVSPLAGVETFALLAERGYRPIELSSVLVRSVDAVDAPASPALRVRPIDAADRDAWVEASVTGWAEEPIYGHLMRPIAETAVANRAMLHFLVERAGAAVATGSLGIHEGIALLGGASTVPLARGLGAQALLLAARLAHARERGCELAMIVASPGSTSQRNAERRGFRVAYTRTKWRLTRREA
jgi:GNAT superfamily N-acetyltransferase